MTDRYAVIGNPIAHSKSPLIQAEFAKQMGHDMSYEALLAPLDGFGEAVTAFRNQGGRGMNVTLPFKLKAFDLATEKSPRALDAGAVNMLKFSADSVFGDNTDGVGLTRDITRNLGISIRDKRVLLIGAGGAARGVIYPVLQEAPLSLALANRTFDKAQELITRYFQISFFKRTHLAALNFAELAGQSFDIVINASSASVTGDMLPLPANLFARGSLAYEMMYGKGKTPFLKFAREDGAAKACDGLGMLVEQAAESFYLWRGVRPDTQFVLNKLKNTVA
jgi:shikimate dehydrogenase